eukprot:scaffold2224_cov261-Pinguiococcus_pyrenoidosus.AAC.48
MADGERSGALSENGDLPRISAERLGVPAEELQRHSLILNPHVPQRPMLILLPQGLLRQEAENANSVVWRDDDDAVPLRQFLAVVRTELEAVAHARPLAAASERTRACTSSPRHRGEEAFPVQGSAEGRCALSRGRPGCHSRPVHHAEREIGALRWVAPQKGSSERPRRHPHTRQAPSRGPSRPPSAAFSSKARPELAALRKNDFKKVHFLTFRMGLQPRSPELWATQANIQPGSAGGRRVPHS